MGLKTLKKYSYHFGIFHLFFFVVVFSYTANGENGEKMKKIQRKYSK